MGALINLNINLDKLAKEKIFEGKKGNYYSLTLSINDETRYGNNVSVADSQTKEEREAKKPKNYIGNGNVVWTDGKIVLADREDNNSNSNQQNSASTSGGDDLPF